MMGDVKSYLNEYGVEMEDFPLKPIRIAELIHLIEEGKISTSVASQRLFPEMIKQPDSVPSKLAESLNLIQDNSTEGILHFVHQMIEENPKEVERYKHGEKQLIGFLMGQLMKISKGKAEPKTANELIRKTLDNL
jgi:aspartyl-tRNA(Asn)/glutamyl-tRNA(Gln) amidotransferase subunit B